MKINRLLHEIEQGKEQDKEFIKWWRKENDFVDYQLLDDFVKTARPGQEFENFELLNKEQMWEILERWNPEGVRISNSTKGRSIEWRRRNAKGEEEITSCPYNARSIMSIFDQETRGDTLL